MRATSLCFIGGWGSTEAVWGATLSHVAGQDPHLLSTADVGHHEFLSWLECIEDWPGALAKLHSLAQPCVLVGWSLGGLLAMRAALDLAPPQHAKSGRAGDPEAPEATEKIAALVLVSATPRMCGTLDAGGDYIGADRRALAAMRTRIARTPEAVLEEFAAACAEPDGGEETRESWLRQARQFSAEQLAAGLECLATLDLRERLGKIAVPCRVLHGECDCIVPLGSAQFLARQMAPAELSVLRGRGHALPFTAPAEIARCITEVAVLR